MPESSYLTLKQAATFTGKSHSTLRRFIKSILDDQSSADRRFLRPDADEEKKLKESKQPFQWEIADELLRREFMADEGKEEATPDSAAEPNAVGGGDWSMLLKMLQTQLQEKDDQLRRKDEHIDQLTERLKEANILQQTTLTALPAGRAKENPVTVATHGGGESSSGKSGNDEGANSRADSAEKPKTTRKRKATPAGKKTKTTTKPKFWSGLFGR